MYDLFVQLTVSDLRAGSFGADGDCCAIEFCEGIACKIFVEEEGIVIEDIDGDLFSEEKAFDSVTAIVDAGVIAP